MMSSPAPTGPTGADQVHKKPAAETKQKKPIKGRAESATRAPTAKLVLAERDDLSDDKFALPDSDSGHGPTPASSSVSQTSENSDDQQADDFVDASEVPLDGGTDAELDQASNERASAAANSAAPPPGGQLEDRIEETSRVLRMALSNEFVKALEICGQGADRELYASLANATLSFLRAALTLEQADLQAALAAINLSFEVSSRQRRRQSTASMMMRLIYRPDYNAHSDDEIHAELVHAESLLLLALISFLADQSLVCLVRGAFRIRACYQRYKECLYILESRKRWASAGARRHFESGVRLGHGVFNLLMSYLPRRVLRFLEYVGFSGNRSLAVAELDKSVALDDGLRSVFSALVILTYHTYVENLFGLGDYDELKVNQLNNTFLGHYPNSAFFLLFLGRYHQMRGERELALDSFQRCIEAQSDWRQFHSICHWEMMWCHASQLDWARAAHYADLLRHHSKWSPASYTYQRATFLYAQLVEDERRGREPTETLAARRAAVRELMLEVPRLRIRYAGKTIPAEKFAITRAGRFCDQAGRLTLPALEFLYVWNQFPMLRNSPAQLERLLQRLEDELEHLRCEEAAATQAAAAARPTERDRCELETGAENEAEQQYVDDVCLVQLLKGMCLKHLHRFEEAERCFMEVVEREHDIRKDTFLVPHTAMELATLNLTLKRFEQARCWIKAARSNYTGYLLETIVHFRLHAASRLIRLEQLDQELAGSSCDSASCARNAETGAAPAGSQVQPLVG